MRALVTGGAGFIGSTLVDRLLAEGHTVDVVDDLSTGSLANLADARSSAGRSLTFHNLDVRSAELTDLMAKRRPEVVFHLAAQADVRVSVAQPVLRCRQSTCSGRSRCSRERGQRRPAGSCSPPAVARSTGSPTAADLPVRSRYPHRPLSPVRGVEEGRHRLPGRLPGAALARVLGAGSGQRLRTSSGSTRRGRAWWPSSPSACCEDSRSPSSATVSRPVTSCTSTTWWTHSSGVPRRAAGLVCNIGTGRETSVNQLYGEMVTQAGLDVTRHLRAASPGGAAPEQPRSWSRRDPAGLEAVDHPGCGDGRRPRVHPAAAGDRGMRRWVSGPRAASGTAVEGGTAA